MLCLNPTASPRLAIDRFGAVRAFAGGARAWIVAPDSVTADAIGPNLSDARRRATVEAAGYRQGRALASRA